MAGERVLIVEDDVAMDGAPLERLLVSEGYRVVGIARSSEEATAMTAEHHPEVVLMDIEIPRTITAEPGSHEGVRAAKLIASMHNPSIIFVTCQAPSDDLMQRVAAVSTATTFVKKPYSNAQILADIKLAIMRRRPAPKNVFVCYAHEDRDVEEELRKFLGAMSTVGMTFWDDRQLEIGSAWRTRLDEAIASAQAAVLLVSIDFMRSHFIRHVELPALRAAAARRGLLLVPVFLDAVPQPLIEEAELDGFLWVNGPDDPIRAWSRFRQHRDCWTVLCERLFDALKLRATGG